MILKNIFSWDVRPCSLADIYRSFRGTSRVQIQIYSEKWGRTFLRNVCKFILDYKPSRPRRQYTQKKINRSLASSSRLLEGFQQNLV